MTSDWIGGRWGTLRSREREELTMATTETSHRARTRRMRAAYVDRFDPSAARWLQRERHPHPQRWCDRVRVGQARAARTGAGPR
jgi:hypothetical protein